MRGIIITVAGLSSRFNKNLDMPCLKCIYHEGNPKDAILSLIVNTVGDYDQYVIVGGYKFDELNRFIVDNLVTIKDKITLVYNDKYIEYGSGYSLYLGIAALDKNIEDVTFVEGDLIFDKESFLKLKNSSDSIITVSNDFVVASKSVALYIDVNNKPHYIYDTKHNCLFIKEPFVGIFNSAQIWKFSDASLLYGICEELTETEMSGTNLIIIQKYYDLYKGKFDILEMKKWCNCNTVYDYQYAIKNYDII